MHKEKLTTSRRIALFGTALFLALVLNDLSQIAWGTGSILDGFSLRWGGLFLAAFLFLLLYFVLLRRNLLGEALFPSFTQKLIGLRSKAPILLYLAVLLLLAFSVYFFQYTFWGLIFTGVFLRLFVWINLTLLIAVLLTKSDEQFLSWRGFFVSALLSGAAFTLAGAFSNVTDYPFNLYWSDGNRLWDYSVMFGRELYNYPPDQPINAFISSGRQFLLGLPFLLPNTSILFNRFWSALVMTVPYMLLGWVAFKTKETKPSEAFLLALWTFLFLNQGPIYTPLVLSAILVALAWERSLWLAIPLVAFAGYYAEVTRWTWEFAPSIWAGMMSLSGSKLKHARLAFQDWVRAAVLAISGILLWAFAGDFPNLQGVEFFLAAILTWTLLAVLLEKLSQKIEQRWEITAAQRKRWGGILVAVAFIGLLLGGKSILHMAQGIFASIRASVTTQPLLWTRLLPNDTYPEGILGGLLIALAPLVILLLYLIKKKYWQPSLWQKLTLGAALLPFFVVGLIISTKIGGGNNLHNLDMFLIAMLFVAAIAWRNGGRAWFTKNGREASNWTKVLLIALVAVPAYAPLMGIRPRLSLSEGQIKQVEILADVAGVESLPNQNQINDALWYLNHKINDAQEAGGEILFIDQRQLLTFGYVPKIPLVPEYEKKRMMNEAMSSNAAYFAPYYKDLAAHRFSLIITEPLKIDFKEEEGIFAAENDLWAKWVAAPTLCYYEPLKTLWDVYIQLLVPREEPIDCTPYLP